MRVTILPSLAHGEVPAPPSKSMAHRLLIPAGLADGESVIRGLSMSDDVAATIACLRALGAKIRFDGSAARVHGIPAGSFLSGAVLPCHECGSTLRFLIPVALRSRRKILFTGSEKLLSRPLGVYRDLAAEHGLTFDLSHDGLLVCGPLEGGTFRFPGNISSQFVSGLLMALPSAKEDSRIELIPPLASRPYIDMTIDALSRFGIRILREGDYAFRIPGNQRFTPCEATVEGDHSNAANLAAFGLIGGKVQITGLSPHSLQGDRVFADSFEKLQNGFAELDLTDCPDLGPILFAASALCHGARFTGTERLRIKESDRVASMAEELEKCGVQVQIGRDSVVIEKAVPHQPDKVLSSHNDHRVAMALTLLLSRVGGSLDGAEAVKKSFPDYFETIKALGIKVQNNGMDL